ncbi:MAG: hypothetical protein BEN18_10595 [Epulopiscium sp. Nuni2H_MBin001]|nr:MAG: hypothetical protein BEN18_10595 [Epulopiscium sp. Nuni2H_MBin001]
MFGYVRPLKEELKIREYDGFKSYYCGLCHHIKKDYGDIPRFTLSYDVTTMGILLDALGPSSAMVKKKTCISRPVTKFPTIQNNLALKYASTVNVLLAYYKLLDDVDDEDDLKSKALALSFKPYLKNVPKELKFLNKVIKENLAQLHRLESTQTFSSLDEIAHPFANLVGSIVKLYPYPLRKDSRSLRANLYTFGYKLGKWIYLIDALDDFESDTEQGKFNALYCLYKNDTKTMHEEVDLTLYSCEASCKEILDKLPLRRNRAVLSNIVTLGMMDRYYKVANSCKSKQSNS